MLAWRHNVCYYRVDVLKSATAWTLFSGSKKGPAPDNRAPPSEAQGTDVEHERDDRDAVDISALQPDNVEDYHDFELDGGAWTSDLVAPPLTRTPLET